MDQTHPPHTKHTRTTANGSPYVVSSMVSWGLFFNERGMQSMGDVCTDRDLTRKNARSKHGDLMWLDSIWSSPNEPTRVGKCVI